VKNKNDILKIVFIIIGIIILILIGVYIYNKFWNKQSCNCLPLNISSATINQSAAAYTDMTAADVKTALDTDKSIILVDVRTEEEYNQGHISGSVLIPLDQLPDKAETELANKDAKIIVYCRSGARSSAAAQTLADLGYTNVYNMVGGISSWGYETEK